MQKSQLLAMIVPVLLAGCSVHKVETPPSASLGGTSWRLAALQSNDDAIGIVHPDDPAKYEMTLGADGRASLRLDCNRANGHWESPAANQITFTPLMMTRAACPPGSLDTRIARELGYVRTFMREGDKLTLLMMADGGSQVWTRKAN